MGLDMYLYAERYYFNIDFRTRQKNPKHEAVLRLADLANLAEPDHSSCKVNTVIAYWRKANAIHSWFVKNVQNGNDDCHEHDVAREQIEELVALCKDVIVDYKAGNHNTCEEKLPPQDGFFFGGTGIDEWYLADLEYTVTRLTEILEKTAGEEDIFSGVSFSYRSSW